MEQTGSTTTGDESASEFAVGENSFHGCQCPASAAGCEPGYDKSTEVAGAYDSLAIENYDTHLGTISEEKAKSLWLQAIKDVREQCGEGPEWEAGRTVAEAHGWL